MDQICHELLHVFEVNVGVIHYLTFFLQKDIGYEYVVDDVISIGLVEL